MYSPAATRIVTDARGRTKHEIALALVLRSLMAYLLLHLYVRSFTDGLDADYGTSLSAALSAVLVVVSGIGAMLIGELSPVARRMLALFAPFLVLSVVSTLHAPSIDSSTAITTLSRYIYLGALIVLLDLVCSSRAFLPLLGKLYPLILLTYSCIALVQYATGSALYLEPTDVLPRVRGLASHPVNFSIELAIVAVVADMCRRKMSRRLSAFALGLYALSAAALGVAASRTGILIIAITVALYVLANRPRTFLPVIGISVIVILVTPLSLLFHDLQTLPAYIAGQQYLAWDYRLIDSSLHWRVYHWYYLIDNLRPSLLLGIGAGQEIILSPFRRQAHSMFVEILVESGILGLFAFLGFWLSMAVLPFRRRLAQLAGGDRTFHALRSLWLALFASVSLAALLSVSLNYDVVALSHLLVGYFVLVRPTHQVSGALWPQSADPRSGSAQAIATKESRPHLKTAPMDKIYPAVVSSEVTCNSNHTNARDSHEQGVAPFSTPPTDSSYFA